MEEVLLLKGKWGNVEFELKNLTACNTLEDLKEEISKQIQVMPHRQKLINLKPKTADGKLVVIGSQEKDIEQVQAASSCDNNVINDFVWEETPLQCRVEYLTKIANRIKKYQIKFLSSPRTGKKLLVLDIDYTLFDHHSVGENGAELMRPYLHEFLTLAYEDYDIMIWSATSMKWIDNKLKVLGITGNLHYSLLGCMDEEAMISVNTGEGVVDVKPLGVIWGLLPMYGAHNTIMFDDVRHNFLMNPQNGLKIKAFRKAHFSRHTDEELVYLSKYLKAISHMAQLDHLNHDQWKKFVKKYERKRSN